MMVRRTLSVYALLQFLLLIIPKQPQQLQKLVALKKEELHKYQK